MTYLNCYEQDEIDQWYERMEDLAFDDDNSDNNDDHDLKVTYYPEQF